MANNDNDNDNAMTQGTSNRDSGAEGLREGATGASGIGQDPDRGADMSDTGGAQWDSVFEAGGIQNEPGLEGLRQDAPNTTS